MFLFSICDFFSPAGGKVIIIIGGDDNYTSEDEEDRVVISRWAKRKIHSQFSDDFLDGSKSFIFSWNKKHREIHEEALLHYFDSSKKGQKFEYQPKPRQPESVQSAQTSLSGKYHSTEEQRGREGIGSSSSFNAERHGFAPSLPTVLIKPVIIPRTLNQETSVILAEVIIEETTTYSVILAVLDKAFSLILAVLKSEEKAAYPVIPEMLTKEEMAPLQAPRVTTHPGLLIKHLFTKVRRMGIIYNCCFKRKLDYDLYQIHFEISGFSLQSDWHPAMRFIRESHIFCSKSLIFPYFLSANENGTVKENN